MTHWDKVKLIVCIPTDYFKGMSKHKRVVERLKPVYQKSYTKYFFSIVGDLLVNGEVSINKYAEEEVTEVKGTTGRLTF